MGESPRNPDQSKSVNDRQDTYLYGHPGGRRKRYRSPADFFNHLLWLTEDESGNPDNCTCKICAPDDIQMLEEFPVKQYPYAIERSMDKLKLEGLSQTKQGVKQESGIKREPSSQASNVRAEPGTVSTKPMVVIPPRRTASSDSTTKTQTPAKATGTTPNPRVYPHPTTTTSTFPNPLAKLISFEQSEDASYAKYTYRTGEMVWFSRGESGAWGLAVITMRSLYSDRRYPTQKKPKYLVQQLCHPFASFPLKIITDEKDLRPWLAWSPPLLTHEALRQLIPRLTYGNVDWRGVAAGNYGHGDMEVDGSILCAKEVDPSFTPLHPLPQNPSHPNDKLYNALFLGGEKIWVGEPVRLRNDSSDILIVHKIAENISTTPSEFSIVGDIYQFTTVKNTPTFRPPTYNNLSNPTPSASPSTGHSRQPSNSTPQYLPRRLLQDLDFRNRHSLPRNNTTSFWKCTAISSRVPIKDIRGRWYESSTLLRILDPENFEAKLSRGIVDDTAAFLNARSGLIPGSTPPPPSSVATNKTDQQHEIAQQGRLVKDRIDAFGAGVPRGTTISKGDDGPKEQNHFPDSQEEIEREWTARQQQMMSMMERNSSNVQRGQQQHGHGEAQGQGQQGQGHPQQGGGVADKDIAEFMDLDRMEDGYVQNFVEAGGQFFDGAAGGGGGGGAGR